MKKREEIIRENPKAAERLEGRKGTLDSLQRLRAAGIAKGPPQLLSPNGSRYDFGKLPRPNRSSKLASKKAP